MPISFSIPTNLQIAGNLTISTLSNALLRVNAGGTVSTTSLQSNFNFSAGVLALSTALTSINSITSAAGQDLVLGTGTFGPALTINSATGSIAFGNLTAGRVALVGASGSLTDDADLTFSGDTLTATKGNIGGVSLISNALSSVASITSSSDLYLYSASASRVIVGKTDGAALLAKGASATANTFLALVTNPKYWTQLQLRFDQTNVVSVFDTGGSGGVAGIQAHAQSAQTSIPISINPFGGNVLVGKTSDNSLGLLQVNGNATFDNVIAFTGSGVANPYTDSTARVYNQAGVGLTVSGLNIEFRSGSDGTLAFTIDNSQRTVFSAPLSTLTPTTSGAGLRLPHGITPTSPVNGDMWTTSTGLYIRINGSTVGPLGTGGGGGGGGTWGSITGTLSNQTDLQSALDAKASLAGATFTGTVNLSSAATGGIAIYNTADQVTNYERLHLYWSSNVATLYSEKSGSGTTRNLVLGTNGTTGLTINSSQNVLIANNLLLGGDITNPPSEKILVVRTNNNVGTYKKAIQFTNDGNLSVGAIMGYTWTESSFDGMLSFGHTGYSGVEQALNITKLGNVIIGTTVDNSYKLQITGNVKASAEIVSGYGTFNGPGITVGDSQYGMYVTGGHLYVKSASGGWTYFRNSGNTSNTVSIDTTSGLIQTANAVQYVGAITVAANATIQIATGSFFNATYSLRATGTNNNDSVLFSVVAQRYSANAYIVIHSQKNYGTALITNIRVAQSADTNTLYILADIVAPVSLSITGGATGVFPNLSLLNPAPITSSFGYSTVNLSDYSGNTVLKNVTVSSQINGLYGNILSTVTPGIYSNGSSTGMVASFVSNTSFANQSAFGQIALNQTTANANDIAAGVHLSIGGWYQNDGLGIPVHIGNGYSNDATPTIAIVPSSPSGGGKVGIGTTSPAEKLTVYSAAQTAIKVQSANSYDTQLRITDSSADFGVGLNISNTAGAGKFTIYSHTAGAVRFIIDSAGVTTINNTTASTTKDNGALVVEGGVGIEGNLNVGGAIKELVGSTYYNVVSQYDIGTNANQVPLNQYLGTMAYQDSSNVNITGGIITGVTFQNTNIGFSDGSQTSPSITFISDTNTGFYRLAENTIGITLNGILNYYFGEDGYLMGGDGVSYLQITNTGDITLSSTGIMSLLSTGQNLNINISTAGQGYVDIQNNSTANNQIVISALQSLLSGGAGPQLIFGVNANVRNSASIQFYYSGGSGSLSNYVSLGLFGVGGLNVKGNGSVLIGSNADTTYKLDVSGTVRATNAITVDGATGGNTGTFRIIPAGWNGLVHRIGPQYSGDTISISTNASMSSATSGTLDNTGYDSAVLDISTTSIIFSTATAGSNPRTFTPRLNINSGSATFTGNIVVSSGVLNSIGWMGGFAAHNSEGQVGGLGAFVTGSAFNLLSYMTGVNSWTSSVSYTGTATTSYGNVSNLIDSNIISSEGAFWINTGASGNGSTAVLTCSGSVLTDTFSDGSGWWVYLGARTNLSSGITNIKVEFRQTDLSTWYTVSNAAPVFYSNNLYLVGPFAATAAQISGLRVTLTFSSNNNTIYLSELGLLHRNMKFGYRNFPKAGALNTFYNTTDAISTSSASNVFYGGVGIVKKLLVGDTVRAKNYAANLNLGISIDDKTAFDCAYGDFQKGFYARFGTIISSNGQSVSAFESAGIIQTSPSYTGINVYAFLGNSFIKYGSGTVDNYYGVYLTSSSLATNNYAIYASGSNPSYLGGNLTVDGSLAVGGGMKLAVSVKSSSYTTTTSDYIIICNSTSDFTITLIAASSNTGRQFIIKNKNTGVITVDGTGLGQIDGLNTYKLIQYQSLTVVSDGISWNIV